MTFNIITEKPYELRGIIRDKFTPEGEDKEVDYIKVRFEDIDTGEEVVFSGTPELMELYDENNLDVKRREEYFLKLELSISGKNGKYQKIKLVEILTEKKEN